MKSEHDKLIDALVNESLEIGLEAGYRVRAGGYLGSNTEDRLRTGILAALSYYQIKSRLLPPAPEDHNWRATGGAA